MASRERDACPGADPDMAENARVDAGRLSGLAHRGPAGHVRLQRAASVARRAVRQVPLRVRRKGQAGNKERPR